MIFQPFIRSVLAGALLLAAAAISVGEDSTSIDAQLTEALQIMTAGNLARDEGQKEKAIEFYRAALDAYRNFAARYPNLQTAVVTFRINRCASELEMLGYKEKPADPNTNAAPDSILISTPEPTAVPKNSAVITAAKSHLAKGAADEAKTILHTALKAEPDNRNIRLLMAVAQCQSGRYDDAAEILKSLLEEDPNYAHAHAVLGAVHFGKGRTDQALEALRKAIELDPGMGEAYFNIAQIYLSKTPADLETAAIYYKKAVSLGVKPDEKMDNLLKK